MTNIQTTPQKKPLIQVLLLSCGFAGVLFILVYQVFGFATPGFNNFRRTISSLELVKNGWIQQANFIVYGLLTLCFTTGLSKELIKSLNAKLIILFQILIGTGLTGDGIFIHQPLHIACDTIAINSEVIVLVLFTWQFYKSAGWKGWTVYSIVAAFLTIPLLLAFGIAHFTHGWTGLFERLEILPRTVWSIVFITRLLKGRRLVPAAARPTVFSPRS